MYIKCLPSIWCEKGAQYTEGSLSGPAFSAPYKVSNKASCPKELAQVGYWLMRVPWPVWLKGDKDWNQKCFSKYLPLEIHIFICF